MDARREPHGRTACAGEAGQAVAAPAAAASRGSSLPPPPPTSLPSPSCPSPAACRPPATSGSTDPMLWRKERMIAPAGRGTRPACCEKSGRHAPPPLACRQCRCAPLGTGASRPLEQSALDTCYISTPLCKQAGRVRREAGCGQMKARCWLGNTGVWVDAGIKQTTANDRRCSSNNQTGLRWRTVYDSGGCVEGARGMGDGQRGRAPACSLPHGWMVCGNSRWSARTGRYAQQAWLQLCTAATARSDRLNAAALHMRRAATDSSAYRLPDAEPALLLGLHLWLRRLAAVVAAASWVRSAGRA